MKRIKFIFSVLGISGTIAEILLIGIYGCFFYAIADLTIAYIENAEKTGVSLGEFLFTIGIMFAASIILLFIARFVWEHKLNKDEEHDYE